MTAFVELTDLGRGVEQRMLDTIAVQVFEFVCSVSRYATLCGLFNYCFYVSNFRLSAVHTMSKLMTKMALNIRLQ